MATASVQHEQSVLPEPWSDGGCDSRVVSLHEYLTTSYQPDCDYVDGHLEERNLGEFEHATLQGEILFHLRSHATDWDIKALPECRLQVSATSFRIPDIMVLRKDQKVDRIVREGPLVCIEIFSPEDTWARLLRKVKEYEQMGVAHIWAFDPSSREAFRCDAHGFHKVTEAELTIPNTPIRLELAEIFKVLDLK